MIFVSLANLPEAIRQGPHGADLVALIPVFHAHAHGAEEKDARDISKQILWTAYERLLAQLMDDMTEDDVAFSDGFR
jgi:hypothetical protein